MTGRSTEIDRFLTAAGWQDATRSPLAGDASARRYQRLVRTNPPGSAILMDAPPDQAGDLGPFLEMADWLQNASLSAPLVIATDRMQGLALLEDLGDALYARICADPSFETLLYATAIDLLVDLARHSPPPDLPEYSLDIYLREAQLLTDWYLPATIGATPSQAITEEYSALIRTACDAIKGNHRCVVLRDYHAENLLWLPARKGLERVGLLDFQDALQGHPAYDLVSLLEDARRDTSAALRHKMIRRYLAASGQEAGAFHLAYNILGAQRNLKIIGIFTRLYLRDGKAGYLDMIPRVWAHLQRDLGHPALKSLRTFIIRHVPAPTLDVLAQIRAAK